MDSTSKMDFRRHFLEQANQISAILNVVYVTDRSMSDRAAKERGITIEQLAAAAICGMLTAGLCPYCGAEINAGEETCVACVARLSDGG